MLEGSSRGIRALSSAIEFCLGREEDATDVGVLSILGAEVGAPPECNPRAEEPLRSDRRRPDCVDRYI